MYQLNAHRSRITSGVTSCLSHLALGLVILLGSIPLVSTSSALTMVPYSLAELHQEADIIVRGSVSQTRAYRSGGRIFTEVTLTVSAPLLKGTLKGAVEGQSERALARFSLLGGSLDGLTQKVPGSPQVKLGDELIAFLRCDQAQRCAPVGIGQGLWRPLNAHWIPLTASVEWVGEGKPLTRLSLDQLTRD